MVWQREIRIGVSLNKGGARIWAIWSVFSKHATIGHSRSVCMVKDLFNDGFPHLIIQC